MDHNDIRHKLSDYLDDSVSAAEKSEIEKHLESCEQCGLALTELRKTIEQIKTVEEVEPPPWMTRKIMANVRAAAEERKTWFQRFLLPLSLSLPLQAVAVLFLTLGAYYLYQSMQPGARYNEAPSEQFSLKKQSDAPPMKSQGAVPQKTLRNESAQQDNASPPSTEAPQAPEYKALDMKQEYEKPAPPVPAGRLMEGMESTGREKLEKAAPANAPMMAQRQASGAAVDTLQAGPGSESFQFSRKAKVPLSAGKSSACLSYEPAVVKLSGIVKSVDYPGTRDGEKGERGDARKTYWILTLDKEACVSAGIDNPGNRQENHITEVQLVLNPEDHKQYEFLLSKPVIATGKLFQAIGGAQHTPLLLKTETITAR